jgi:hypothetical protein
MHMLGREADSRMQIHGAGSKWEADASVYWTDHSYVPPPNPFNGPSNATHISYHGKEHSLLMYDASHNIVTSKWGKYPCYKHYLYSDPYRAQGTAVGYIYYLINVPQDISSLQSAVSEAVYYQTVYVTNSQTLSNNVNVPTGVTLTLASGATVNLNGYSILISSGGTFTNNGTITGLRAYLKNGSTIKGYCGSINTACNSASTNDLVDIQSGTFSENISFTGKNLLTITGKGINQTNITGDIFIYS